MQCNKFCVRWFATKINTLKPPGYWDNDKNVSLFLDKIREEKNLKSKEDWNSITANMIKSLGGRSLLQKYSMYEIKSMGYPEGKLFFTKPKLSKSPGFWKKEENVVDFLIKLRKSLNLQTVDDWNLLNQQKIKFHGGAALLHKYSIYDLKCLGFPEGKLQFDKPSNFWDETKNITNFLSDIKEKLNLNSLKDWDSLTYNQIKANGGSGLLKNYSLHQIKCMGFPEGKNIFSDSKSLKPPGYWNDENVLKFLEDFKNEFNLKTPKDWNTITRNQINEFGGKSLLNKYSLFDLKCLGCPEGKISFTKPNPKPINYWDNMENVNQFLSDLKMNLNLQTHTDWNSISRNQIKFYGGKGLLDKYSLYELKCFGFPEGKSYFDRPIGYWDDINNILSFLNTVKEKLNLQTPEDWNSLSYHQIENLGGVRLLNKYSMYEIKCMGCPEGKLNFHPSKKPSGYWDKEENTRNFLEDFKEKLDLKTPDDWNRISKQQLRFHGGNGLALKYSIKEIIQMKNSNSFDNFGLGNRRSSQRWLFLQIQKLFPGEEIVEDYFHSEISRQAGCAVQFDIFLVNRNIAIEYHGKQHYEDIPSTGFASVEMYQFRDNEKEKLCNKNGIQLITIPYWWDGNLESLQITLNNKLQKN